MYNIFIKKLPINNSIDIIILHNIDYKLSFSKHLYMYIYIYIIIYTLLYNVNNFCV